MAVKKKTVTAETVDAAAIADQLKPKTTAKQPKKYSLAKLQKDCMELFGVTSSTFAGAVYDLADGAYTIEEIRSHIAAWQKKEVK